MSDGARPVHHSFDAVPETVSRARRRLRAWLEGYGLDGDNLDLRLAVSELVANAVRHGKAPIRMIMVKLPGRIRVEVSDCGGGHPAVRPIQIGGPDAGGWGLRMVDKVVDTWGTETDGDRTMVWIEKALPQAVELTQTVDHDDGAVCRRPGGSRRREVR